uniref:Uncharacterized protein n=1 Tax=Pristionchus pacificus TaxID=54126 RepID=A0A8R1ZAD3_PRIPA
MGCLRGSTKRTRITIDIGVASTLPSPSYELSFYSFSISIFRVSLISPWSNGNILLLIAFFISSNPSIDGKLISLLLRSSRRESIVFVIENVNLLREESWDDLLRESSSETNYPRIVLTSTVQMRVNQSIHSEIIRERTMTKTPKSREGLVTSHRLSISSSPIEGATAVVGLSSKRYLQSKLVSRSCEWIYLDGLESDQLLKECEQLSGEPKGIVSSLVSRNLPQLIYSVPSTSCTRGPTPELSCSHFIILYSYSRDLSFFSSFLTLLTSQERIMDEIEGNPREESPLLSSLPPPYISLSDGSSMYSIRSSSFILCAPNLEEDLRPLGITSIQVKEKSLRGAMDSYRLEWKDKLRDILPRDHTQVNIIYLFNFN